MTPATLGLAENLRGLDDLHGPPLCRMPERAPSVMRSQGNGLGVHRLPAQKLMAFLCVPEGLLRADGPCRAAHFPMRRGGMPRSSAAQG